MSIYLDRKRNVFTLRTAHTAYVMQIVCDRFPAHLYYGKNKSGLSELSYKERYINFCPGYEQFENHFLPGSAFTEYSFHGQGDYRNTALKVRIPELGTSTTEFFYKSARKFKGVHKIPGMPQCREDDETETLELTLCDKLCGATLKLYYTVFPSCDVITRHAELINGKKYDIRIERIGSLQLDLPEGKYDYLGLGGGYWRERDPYRLPVGEGEHSITSRRGASSHSRNPFFMVLDHSTTEQKGDAYGFNLVYSGSHRSTVMGDETTQTRIITSLGDEDFSWLLEKGESFCTPEAVMTYSPHGIGGVSRNMHDLAREHILPHDVTPTRSVILNSWEAFFFDINEDLMSDFARGAKDCGMDTVVMDDGWFGARVGDRAGLGDWHANPDRFKNGLPSFIRSIKSLGIRFGIWIEPEMVNHDSDLYRAHPDWVLAYPDRMRTDARHQYILDFANPEVVENIKAQLAETFDPEPPDYFKWDMNRNMTDAYSHALPPERQDEVPHRYMLGVYDLYSWLREHFPNAMLENCSGGGGRYDLGMMSFSHQIWTSDNTNPEDRINIQYASTLGYPAATMSCHVANHSDSALNPRKLEFGYHVALGGALGYEFNVLRIPEEVRKSLREQIKEYRVYEPLILRGDLYRLLAPSSGAYAYYFAAKDGSEMLLSYIQAKGDPKQTARRLRIAVADKNANYVCTQDGKTYTGEELRHGITVTACTEDEYSRIWHFVRK